MKLLAWRSICILFFPLSSACPIMSTILPSVVLVPGAWTAPKAYHKLIDALKAKAFKTVRETVNPLVDAGQEVIMLIHSYGGIAGTSAIRNLTRKDRQTGNLPGGVVSLIYAAAFILTEGQTIQIVVQAVTLPGRSSLVKFSSDNSTWFPIDPIWLLHNGLGPEDQEE
ncbi:hypothetical protein N7453_001740 [Penicillium expansum]|nr:hypothetical protein N7453_001740 [Penicillium expansum]